MRKIQFDLINGVYEVKEFDAFIDIIDNFSMAYLELDDESKGEVVYGAEVDEDLYFLISNEYGIKNL